MAIVAASVIATASATGTGVPRRTSPARRPGASASRPMTAANESCQPGSPAARGLRASVPAAASPSAYQRDAGRPASAATSPAAPMIPARWIDGPPPASGTYTATSTSAVTRRARSPAPTTAPAAMTSTASSITFCPETARMWASPEAWNSSRTSSARRSS